MILYKKKVIRSLNLENLVNYVNQLWKIFLNCKKKKKKKKKGIALHIVRQSRVPFVTVDVTGDLSA